MESQVRDPSLPLMVSPPPAAAQPWAKGAGDTGQIPLCKGSGKGARERERSSEGRRKPEEAGT